MKTCKDNCLHYEVCLYQEICTDSEKEELDNGNCEYLTDCSEWMHLEHGKWTKCYQSGVTVAEGYVSSCCDMWNNRNSDYCPNCGAKMDG